MDRQTIIETNRSLRLIKNELEALLEKGVLSDAAFDSISALLPAETPLSAAGRATTATATTKSSTTLPTSSTTSTTTTTAVNTPASSINSASASPAPPSYAQSTATPPTLPIRTGPAAPEPPAKPVLARARALYRYTAAEPRDLSFERDDRIEVHEYMNDDWWLGRNVRTGQEGIFPRNYVMVDPVENEKKGSTPVPIPGYPLNPPAQPQYGQAPPHGYPAPAPGQPVPEEEKESKLAENGKKFGKKLGNAAIFGAGATIGSNIVNSIF
ncbi:hypothetical protein VTJ04DRAFT_2640 [Mycothermus thermophilus]|uniref:uncharacterized protein n=1 Tax=Humicola insolens TaxID=85995 RepID=UPI0037436FD6